MSQLWENVTSCPTLKHVAYSNDKYFCPLHAYNQYLESLCIQLCEADIDDTFMCSVSAHGGLAHVVLFVKSVTGEGVATLIEDSSKLTVFHLCTDYMSFAICTEELQFYMTSSWPVLSISSLQIWKSCEWDLSEAFACCCVVANCQ